MSQHPGLDPGELSERGAEAGGGRRSGLGAERIGHGAGGGEGVGIRDAREERATVGRLSRLPRLGGSEERTEKLLEKPGRHQQLLLVSNVSLLDLFKHSVSKELPLGRFRLPLAFCLVAQSGKRVTSRRRLHLTCEAEYVQALATKQEPDKQAANELRSVSLDFRFPSSPQGPRQPPGVPAPYRRGLVTSRTARKLRPKATARAPVATAPKVAAKSKPGDGNEHLVAEILELLFHIFSCFSGRSTPIPKRLLSSNAQEFKLRSEYTYEDVEGEEPDLSIHSLYGPLKVESYCSALSLQVRYFQALGAAVLVRRKRRRPWMRMTEAEASDRL